MVIEVNGVKKADKLYRIPESNPREYLFIRSDGSYARDLPSY